MLFERSGLMRPECAHRRKSHQRPSLHTILCVSTSLTSAQIGAADLGLITFAIVLQTPGPFAIASLGMLPFTLTPADFGVKREWISFQRHFDSTSTFLFVGQIVHAVVAIAILTQLALCETLTIELQTVGFGAIAGLACIGEAGHEATTAYASTTASARDS